MTAKSTADQRNLTSALEYQTVHADHKPIFMRVKFNKVTKQRHCNVFHRVLRSLFTSSLSDQCILLPYYANWSHSIVSGLNEQNTQVG